MPVSTSRRGGSRERKVVRALRQKDPHATKDPPMMGGGWIVTRTPASQADGPIDLIALKAGHTPMLIQVKATMSSPYSSFGPGDREELLRMARQAGAEAWLVWYPYDKSGSCRWIHPDEWPKPKIVPVAE